MPLAQLDHRDQSDTACDQNIPDEEFSPESEFLNIKLRGIFNLPMSKLSENLRSIIILKEIGGFSSAEIAEISNCSIGTVKSRMHRS